MIATVVSSVLSPTVLVILFSSVFFSLAKRTMDYPPVATYDSFNARNSPVTSLIRRTCPSHSNNACGRVSGSDGTCGGLLRTSARHLEVVMAVNLAVEFILTMQLAPTFPCSLFVPDKLRWYLTFRMVWCRSRLP